MNLIYQMVSMLFQIRLYRICYSKHETLTTISPINICIKRINNRLMFEIKDGYNLELQTSETMILFVAQKN